MKKGRKKWKKRYLEMEKKNKFGKDTDIKTSKETQWHREGERD